MNMARAAIVLADAETAERVAGTDLWAEWERLSKDWDRKVQAWLEFDTDGKELTEMMVARISLDAFVRGLIGRRLQER